jgi:hypothetical protein
MTAALSRRRASLDQVLWYTIETSDALDKAPAGITRRDPNRTLLTKSGGGAYSRSEGPDSAPADTA